MYIGKTLKKLRKQKGLKLSELADLADIQLATLSRIENMKMRGTVESHIKISRALSIDITELYADIIKEDEIDIKVNGEIPTLDIFSHNEKSSYEILTSDALSKKMLPALLQIAPQGKTNTEQHKIGTEKFIYVLEGTIEIIIEDKSYKLFNNNSLYFDASLNHYFINNSNDQSKIITVVTPVTL